MYVQELAEMEGLEIYDLLINSGAHFYVCGDCKMAEDVHQKLKGIVKKHGNMSDDEVQNFMFMLKVRTNQLNIAKYKRYNVFRLFFIV